MTVSIAVVDYGAGNLRSIRRALEAAGAEVVDHLRCRGDSPRRRGRPARRGRGPARPWTGCSELDLVPVLGEVVRSGRPFLGICLGMQLLFGHQEEGDTRGLDLLPGRVRSLPPDVKVPQIGWNRVRWVRDAVGYDCRGRGRVLLRPLLRRRARRPGRRRRDHQLRRRLPQHRPPRTMSGAPNFTRKRAAPLGCAWSPAGSKVSAAADARRAGKRPRVILYPAIDIRGGRCVRLVEGDFTRETVFDADPADAARRWARAGAEWLHVVDLDGAFAGQPGQPRGGRRASAPQPTIPMQLGGGIRDAWRDLERLFDARHRPRDPRHRRAARSRVRSRRRARAGASRIAVGARRARRHGWPPTAGSGSPSADVDRGRAARWPAPASRDSSSPTSAATARCRARTSTA